MRAWIFVLLLAMGRVLAAAEKGSEVSAAVEHLLAAVAKSDAKFVRNGDEHAGKDAAAHMRKKYNHFKKKIKTPEDFIELCATKSKLSEKPYQIKTADGTLVASKDWMLARLEEWRKEQKQKAEAGKGDGVGP
jgi:hypothetical protein